MGQTGVDGEGLVFIGIATRLLRNGDIERGETSYLSMSYADTACCLAGFCIAPSLSRRWIGRKEI